MGWMPLDSPTRLAVRVAGVVTATVLAGVAPTAPDARARPWLLTAHSGPRLVDVAAHDASAGVLEDAVFHFGIEADSLEPASGIEGRVTAAALRSDPDRSLGDRTPPRSLFETPIVGTIGDRVLVWRDGLANGRVPDGSVALGEPVVALALDGATAWVLSSAGLIAGIDVREPASPRVVSTVRDDLRDVGGLPATYAQAAIPQPGLLWRVGASPGGTRLLPTAFVEAWDVSDPERPSKTHREWLRGGFGIVDWDRNAALQAGENFSYGRRGIPRENHLAAIDVAAPDTPTMRARLGFDGWPLVAAVHDRVGWIAVRRRPDDAPDGVLAVDLFDPTLPRLLGWWSEPWEELVATGRGVLLRRGDVLATADLDDPLVPRVLDSAEVPMADVAWDPERWHPVEPVIRRSGDGAVVRLADGRLGLVDPGAPGLPVPRVPWVPGAVVREVVGSGERLAWRDEADRWRVARSDAPGLTEHVLVPQAGALASSHGGAMLWLASPEGLHVADAAGGRAIRAMLPITGVRQLAAEGEALWLLRGAPPRIEAWDVAASAPRP